MDNFIVENLSYSYDTHQVLKHINLSFGLGEYIYLLGPNGVGKSTLFRCILGHLKALQGRVIIDGKSVSSYSKKELARKIAYIPQVCMQTFNYSVLEIVMMGRSAHLGLFKGPSIKDEQIARNALRKLGLEKKADWGIHQISGGERQLMMIARALVQEPQIIMMDEPTAHLDYGNQMLIQMQMKQLAKEGLLIIQSSHNPQQALFFGDKVVAMKAGKIIGCGKPDSILNADFIKTLYGLEVTIHQGVIIPKFTETRGETENEEIFV